MVVHSVLLRDARAAGLCGAALFLTSPLVAAQLTERVSLDSTGAQAVGASSDARVSENGRYVVFSTLAALDPLDTNGFRDVYRYDRNTGAVDLASVSNSGALGNNDSMNPAVSNDGRFVVFETLASNFGTSGVPDTNGFSDIFVRDFLNSGSPSTDCVSLDFSQLPSGPAVLANGPSRFPDISAETYFDPTVGANVHTITFESDATNLAGAGADTNGVTDIYVSLEGDDGWFALAFANPKNKVISMPVGGQGNGPSGGQGIPSSSVSETGFLIAFSSSATNLVAPIADTNGVADIFVHDQLTGNNTRVSVDSAGAQAVGGPSTYPAVNSDATRVAFQSTATNLVAGGNSTQDVYVHDLISGETTQASRSTLGATGNAASGRPDISADGAFVAFDSLAGNLLATGDTNAAADVFVHSVLGHSTMRASLSAQNGEGDLGSSDVCLTANGSQMVFASDATNLIGAGVDTNAASDVFFRGCDSQASVYCTAKVNSQGCVPSISFNGSASATAGSGFNVTTRNLINQTTGLYIYGVNSFPWALPHQGGYICFTSPLLRTTGAATGGSATGTDCTGVIDFDFNAFLATLSPTLPVGTTIRAQCWSRDVADPFGSSFSDAVLFTICD
jgi:hypothetical protein